jgi:hypothetical protein
MGLSVRVHLVDSTEYDHHAEAVVRFSRDDGALMRDPVSGALVPWIEWRTPFDRTIADLHARAEAHAVTLA